MGATAPPSCRARGEARVQRGHPWIFRSDVARVEGAAPGTVVRVLGARAGGRWASRSTRPRSEITLRMIDRGDALPDDFLRDRLHGGARWREAVAPRRCARCRLVHGEGDGLPSLWWTATATTWSCRRCRRASEALKDRDRRAAGRAAGAAKGSSSATTRACGSSRAWSRRWACCTARCPTTVEVDEGGLRLAGRPLARPEDGPVPRPAREPRRWRASTRAAASSTRFTYNGGFALQVARAATEVLAVDVSAEALARVPANAARNGFGQRDARGRPTCSTCCASCRTAGERFDTVILDPPAFAKSKDAVEKARRGYKEINLRALKLLRARRHPDHLLVLVPRARGRLRGDPGRGRRRRRTPR